MPKRISRTRARILEHTTDAFIFFDADERYAYVSPEAVRLSGKPAKSFIGKRFLDVYKGERAHIFYKKYREALRTHTPTVFEHFYPQMQKWLAVRIYPHSDGSASAYFNDITRHKNAEARAQEHEEQARSMLEHVKDYAIFMLDPEGRVRSWNSGAERIHGYTEEDIVGKHIRTFYTAEEQEAGMPEDELREAAKKGRSEREGRRVRKDGTSFWSNAIVRVIKGADRKVVGFIKVTRDVTERIQAEQALQEKTFDLQLTKDSIEREKAHGEALLNSIGEGVVATDADGNVVLINRQAQIMLGIPESRALGRHFSKVWVIENDQGVRLPPEEYPTAVTLRTGKKTTSSKYWYYSHPHNRFPAAATASPIVFNKKVLGGVIVFRNIAKEKEIDRAKSEFVSLASHQLRTPLTAIKLFGEMLTGGGLGPLTPQQRSIVQSIDTSNDKMIALVNALLNVSRIESGRLKPKPELVDLPVHIEEIVTEARAVGRLKQCTVKFRVPTNTDLPLVVTDPALLRQVIANLVMNAVQYSPARRTVTVTLQKKKDGYIVGVKDQGIGIPKSARSRIFERFYRAPGAIKKKTDGTGLGLYMSRMIMELLGGKIWFRSQERKGSLFSISIPFSTTPEPPPVPKKRKK